MRLTKAYCMLYVMGYVCNVGMMLSFGNWKQWILIFSETKGRLPERLNNILFNKKLNYLFLSLRWRREDRLVTFYMCLFVTKKYDKIHIFNSTDASFQFSYITLYFNFYFCEVKSQKNFCAVKQFMLDFNFNFTNQYAFCKTDLFEIQNNFTKAKAKSRQWSTADRCRK